MTETEIDCLIERIQPDLVIALKAMLAGAPVHIFNLADGTNSKTGAHSKLVLFLAHEGVAAILEGTVRGIDESAKVYQRMLTAAAQAGIDASN